MVWPINFIQLCTSPLFLNISALIHYNCRSLAKNFAMIRDHLTSLDSMFDVIALSETWLNDDNSDSFNLDGYDLVSCSRSSKKGGGVGLYI